MKEVFVKRFRPETEAECLSINCTVCVYDNLCETQDWTRPSPWDSAITKPELNPEEHKQRHELLHHFFDELMADFIKHTEGLPSKTTLTDLGMWSSKQMKEPTPDKEGK